MIIVQDIFGRVKKILGNCTDDHAYEKLNAAIEILKNEGNWNPLLGFMDICTQDCVITLPYDVDTPMAVNVGGRPADFRNMWFQFHMNGPGTECCEQGCYINWENSGLFPTFRDIIDDEAKLLAVGENPSDDGAVIRAYGYDAAGKWIMEENPDGTLSDGFDVPIFHVGQPVAQKIKRITRISKPQTLGFVRLVALDDKSSAGTMIGEYRPYETEPQYRRMKVSGPGSDNAGGRSCTTWVRMMYRRKQSKVSELSDPIFLHSQEAIIRAVQAVRKYDADLFEEGDKYLARAVSFLNKRQKAEGGPRKVRIQFDPNISMGSGLSNMI